MRSNRTAFERVDLCDIVNLHRSTSCFASQKEYIRTFYALLVTNFDPKGTISEVRVHHTAHVVSGTSDYQSNEECKGTQRLIYL